MVATKTLTESASELTTAQAITARAGLKLDRLGLWASQFRGLKPFPSVMAVPPTMTRASTSQITGSSLIAWDDTRITKINPMYEYAAGVGVLWTTTAIDAAKTGPLGSIGFQTDAPEFEVLTKYWQNAMMNFVVDGELCSVSNAPIGVTSGGNQYFKHSFGISNPTPRFTFIGYPIVVVNGSGYVPGEIITPIGGTFTRAATFAVTTVNGSYGAATLFPVDGGDYTVLPSGTVASTSSGAGTGCTMALSASVRLTDQNKVRSYIGYMTGGFRFGGIQCDPKYAISPLPAPSTPKVVFVGDSQSAGTYPIHGAFSLPVRIMNRLGWQNSSIVSANGGTGWNNVNGNFDKWSSDIRIADFNRFAADLYVFIGSQNDAQNYATQAAITTTLNSLCNSMPNAKFVGIGSVVGTGSSFTKAGWEATKAGWEATNAFGTRCAYIDNVANPFIINGTGLYLSSDGSHLGPGGINAFGDVAATQIADAVINLCGLSL